MDSRNRSNCKSSLSICERKLSSCTSCFLRFWKRQKLASTSKQSLPRGVSTPSELAYHMVSCKFYYVSCFNFFTVQIYCLQLLHTLKVDPTATDMEAPTPRAISERLVKIRTMAKANFTVSSGKNSAPSTPRKKVSKEPVLKKAGGGVVKKKGIARKRAVKVERYANY